MWMDSTKRLLPNVIGRSSNLTKLKIVFGASSEGCFFLSSGCFAGHRAGFICRCWWVFQFIHFVFWRCFNFTILYCFLVVPSLSKLFRSFFPIFLDVFRGTGLFLVFAFGPFISVRFPLRLDSEGHKQMTLPQHHHIQYCGHCLKWVQIPTTISHRSFWIWTWVASISRTISLRTLSMGFKSAPFPGWKQIKLGMLSKPLSYHMPCVDWRPILDERYRPDPIVLACSGKKSIFQYIDVLLTVLTPVDPLHSFCAIPRKPCTNGYNFTSAVFGCVRV